MKCNCIQTIHRAHGFFFNELHLNRAAINQYQFIIHSFIHALSHSLIPSLTIHLKPLMLNGSTNVLARIFQKCQIRLWIVFHFQNPREIQVPKCRFELRHGIAEYSNEGSAGLHNLIHDVTVEACVIAKDVGKGSIKQHDVEIFPVES